MFKTREISIGPAFRFVLGILGIIVLGTGLFLSVQRDLVCISRRVVEIVIWFTSSLCFHPGVYHFCAVQFEGGFPFAITLEKSDHYLHNEL